MFYNLVNKHNKHRTATKTLTAITFILLLTLTTATSIELANAHTPPLTIPTYAFIVAAPDVIGVGQQATIVFWLNNPPPTASGAYGDVWRNMTVTVTRPDGSTEKLGPFNSDPVGSSYALYTPTQVGNYYFQMSYPGQTLALVNPNPNSPSDSSRSSPYIGDIYQPCTSSKATLVVQQAQIQQYQAAPLPTGFWQRPINANNREWSVISGNWLGANSNGFGSFRDNMGSYNPYSKAPNSPHIIWTKPIAFGGIVGGQAATDGTLNYYTGREYEPKFTPPIIMNGVLYYNTPSAPYYGFYAVDLRTGQTLWWHNSTGVTTASSTQMGNLGYPGVNFGQLLYYESPNQYGATPYLWSTWGSTYSMYDAYTGNWILNLANASSGTIAYSQNGDVLVYVLNSARNWLAMWNSTAAISYAYSLTPVFQSNGYWMWRPPLGVTADWLKGIMWNVTTPNVSGQAISRVGEGVIVSRATINMAPGLVEQVGYSATDGHLLWTYNATGDEAATGSMAAPTACIGSGVFAIYRQETMQWYGFSLATGNKVWGPTTPYTNAWGMYVTNGINSEIVNGVLYSMAMDGIHAFNATTGASLWYYPAQNAGFETPYGIYPFVRDMAMADGKIFATSGHTHLIPLFRGAKLYAIDAATGTLDWSILGWMQNTAIADGILVTLNAYDNQIYAFGQGKTATTISASPITVAQGSPTTIQGTVTDQSPGQTCLGMPAAGTPAIADAYMEPWMEYLYEQQPMPTNATGVQVALTALDPNGNTEIIGNVTSDITGNYAIQWTPPVPGVYKVTATFYGSNSYYSSTAETAISVAASAQSTPKPQTTNTPAPSASPTAIPTPTPTGSALPSPSPSPVTPPTGAAPATTTYIVIAVALILVVVAAAVLILKRRK